jgi:signal transduction histidine kinase
MKRIGIYLALVAPAVGLALWALFPEADPTFAAPLFHFYIVTFTTFAATVVSLFVTISVGQTALPRHLLLAVAFAWMGAVFLLHGATTPGALIATFHPAITWSAWLTLFGGGGIFLLAAFAPNQPSPRFLRTTVITIALIYAIYVILIFSFPKQFSVLLSLAISPTLADLAFIVTLIVWLAAGVKLYTNFQQTHNFVDGLMAFESGWYTVAAVSMFRFPLYQASWWLYHVLLLLGFLIATYALWHAYEQVRSFRLTRYYAGTSLIVTAALALVAAQIYTNLMFSNLSQQLESDTGALSAHLSFLLASSLPNVTTTEGLHDLNPAQDLATHAAALQGSLQDIDAVTLYDSSGMVDYDTPASGSALSALAPPDLGQFHAAMNGQTAFILNDPGAVIPDYKANGSVHVLETYVPFWPAGNAKAAAPIGVLLTVRELPELTNTVLLSRVSGLLLAGLSLGGLFLALLLIVNRADVLIRTRTQQLEVAYANLRQAEGMRDDLTNMIVHDLRNPLTALTANLDLIGKTMNNPAYPDAPPRFLAGARQAGQRMTGMIDDLLNVSKFEAGELRLVPAPVYLPTLLGDKIESYRSQAEKENKTLSLSAPADLPTVLADGGLIGRVVDNLLSNAFKYTDTGGTIAVEAENRGKEIVVRVRDNGQGIPPEFVGKIFTKFVQVTKPDGAPLRKGTGLGLAFCRLAVEAHGGKIRVDSEPGHGSIFTFTLPANSNNHA